MAVAQTLAIQNWCPYLLGRKFTVCTDHKRLKQLTRTITPNWQKWAAKLLEYRFGIVYVYKPGLENKGADALSRVYKEWNYVQWFQTSLGEKSKHYRWGSLRCQVNLHHSGYERRSGNTQRIQLQRGGTIVERKDSDARRLFCSENHGRINSTFKDNFLNYDLRTSWFPYGEELKGKWA